MTYIFLIIFFVFFALASWFLYLNDFSNGTVEILFPAIGAVIFSLYLAVKFIWIDQPPTNEKYFDVSFMHDPINGKIYSLFNKNQSTSQEDDDLFRGFEALEFVLSSKELREFNFEDKLLVNEGEYLSNDFVADLFELTILSWLGTNTDLRFGVSGYTTHVISGSAQTLKHTEKYEKFNFDFSERTNEYLASIDTLGGTPTRTRIVFAENHGGFSIKSPYSELKIFPVYWHNDDFKNRLKSKHPNLFISHLGLNAEQQKYYTVVTSRFYSKLTQRPYRRLSTQAQKEKEWLLFIQQQLGKEFSINLLRSWLVRNI